MDAGKEREQDAISFALAASLAFFWFFGRQVYIGISTFGGRDAGKERTGMYLQRVEIPIYIWRIKINV